MEEENGKNKEFMCKRIEVLVEFERTLKAEEIFWHQKTKCKWIREGDGNMSFFHRVANR